MSASLVGSEMCIRDRHYPPPETQAASQDALEWAGPRVRAAGRFPVPVSYTHLTLPTICSV
eukprot:13806152-Alexandrium_andersonii.AAC.1